MPSKRTIIALASAADVDPRTAEKALKGGLAAVRQGRIAERLAEAALGLGVKFPDAKSTPPSAA